MNVVDAVRVKAAALSPGPSVVSVLPGLWTVAPSDDGAWLVLGGEWCGAPEVYLRVEQAVATDGGSRDLGEPVAWLVAECLARLCSGRTEAAELSEQERAELTSALRMMLQRGGRGPR